MAEQTFLSPGFFEREIDLSQRSTPEPSGVPGGVIGLSEKGPAFVPVTVANFDQFQEKFGSYNINMPGVYASELFLRYKTSLTYMRVLGAGANSDTEDFEKTKLYGITKNAGFFVSGSNAGKSGFVHFIAASHQITGSEATQYPVLTNSSISDPDVANLLRGMLFFTTGSRAILASSATSASSALLSEPSLVNVSDTFKIIISSSLGSSYGNDEGVPGVKVYSVSLDPNSTNYISNVLNSDPTKFVEEQHLLYAHFPIEAEIASPISASLMLGSNEVIKNIDSRNIDAKEIYGRFDARYSAPTSPYFISQPFGDKEFKLFKFESLDDGDYASSKYKISISNLRLSEDETNPYGTFTVLIRDWNDSDKNIKVLEQFNNCNLNPNSPNYVGKMIGDRKVFFDHDALSEIERGLVSSGKYPNKSKYVRIVLSSELESGSVPTKALPFGFSGARLIKSVSDNLDSSKVSGALLSGSSGLNGAIMPPVPFRFKITDGQIDQISETSNASYYWGVKFEKVTDISNTNISNEQNLYIKNISKFLGIEKLGLITSDYESDMLCNNKFSLSKVVLENYTAIGTSTNELNVFSDVSSVMKSAKYIRNATVINGKFDTSITLSSLINESDPTLFNKYSRYMKFTTIMQGGFNGVNILDQQESLLNDKATSFDGCAAVGYKSPGTNFAMCGSTTENNGIVSYLSAARVMTDRTYANHNLLIIPGIKESFITDYVLNRVKNSYGLCLYVMDIPSYNSSNDIIFDNDKVNKPNVTRTINNFSSRNIDNSFSAVYFPDIFIDGRTSVVDPNLTRRVKLPSSVAAFAAISYSDSQSPPWFAPAGFSRGGLNDIVKNISVRIDTNDRNSLYESRINPVAKYPNEGYVIFGQKTLQLKKSSLDRINVRRLMLELRRIVVEVSKGLLFEQNTAELRAQFIRDTNSFLGNIRTLDGIEEYKVVMDNTNNTELDAQNNRLNGKIMIKPTRSIEYIAIDFIITNSSVQFI